MIAEMHKDFDALNILRPDSEPRATHHIAEIIEITEQLIAKGHAYVADNGDVMFDVPTDPNYGLLSRQDLDQLQAGLASTWLTSSCNPMDFVLWKMSKEGEPSWPSPWGWPSGLAYRVLGDELQAAWQPLRYSRRRFGSDVPSP